MRAYFLEKLYLCAYMKVVTLNDRDFNTACGVLEKLVSRDFVPDLVVGIASGGEFVASLLFEDVAHSSVSMHRPSTADKEDASIIFRVLRRSPRFVSDALRIAEACVLRVTSLWRRPQPAVLTPAAREAVEKAGKVLVVDDAIDSGTTMRSVLEAIGNVPGDREVRTAVITQTTRRPRVKPDYAMFREGVLIRFPWSKDFYRL